METAATSETRRRKHHRLDTPRWFIRLGLAMHRRKERQELRQARFSEHKTYSKCTAKHWSLGGYEYYTTKNHRSMNGALETCPDCRFAAQTPENPLSREEK